MFEFGIAPVTARVPTSEPFTYSRVSEPLYVVARCVQVDAGNAAEPRTMSCTTLEPIDTMPLGWAASEFANSP